MPARRVCKAVARMVLAFTSTVVSSGCRVDLATDLVQMCNKHLADPNVRWQTQQRREYLDIVQQALHQGTHHGPDYSRRMDILRASLPLYWTSMTKSGCSQAQFDVHKAMIRWYIETLLSEPLALASDKELLKRQFRDLCDWATEYLQGLYPFLDQTRVQEAKAAVLSRFDTQIDVPLLPIFRRPFTGDQMRQIKMNWAQGYMQWWSVWGRIQRENVGQEGLANPCKPSEHPHYQVIIQCLSSLPQMILPTLEGPPDYVRQANAVLSKEMAEESRIAAQTHKAERDLMNPNRNQIGQVEQWGFVFSALLESMSLEQVSMPSTVSVPQRR